MSHSVHVTESPATMAADAAQHELAEVAAAMYSLSQLLAGDDSARAPLDALVRVAVERVPGARWASISMLRKGRFTTTASTAQQAVSADVMQYDIGSGPCVDAVLKKSLFVTGQVSTDRRWSQWGQRAHAEVGVNSVLSQRLHLQEQAGVVGGLNIYSDTPDAFDGAAVGVALILATYGALVLSQQLASRQAGNLSKALQSNREIGVATGVLMNQYRLTRQEAFDVLRVASQNSNCKLAVVAAEVADTGTLTIAEVGRNQRLPLGQRTRTDFIRILIDEADKGARVSEGVSENQGVRPESLEARVDVSEAMTGELRPDGVLSGEHVAHLQEALRSSRKIGAAVGIVMARLRVDEAHAFQLLSEASQDTNRKLRVLAEELVRTGDLSQIGPQ